MRTTISIPDTLAERIRQHCGGVTLSELTRRALVNHMERLDREELAQAMREGNAAEAASPLLDRAMMRSPGSTQRSSRPSRC